MRTLSLWVGVALLACAHAGTMNRRPAAPVKITSLTDKDAKRKAMEHPAFSNAGQQAGIEIWRIEDFEPVLVPQKDFGKFYKGDSYIVLKTTTDKRNNKSWDIHYWLGGATSQDEAGAAAILTVGLDDKFNGAAIQHREVEGHESSQFIGYFPPAIRYMDGGHASGFSHVTTNAGAEKRLFQIKGKRNVRVRQVDPLISSMNKGDCFILDVDQSIFVYVGERAKNVEKLKAISVANQVRDQDHNGRGRVDIIDQYSSESDTQRFFTALGSGNRAVVPEESAGGDDQTFERSEEQTVTLSEISDSTGKLKVTPLPKPYRQEQLSPQECYILDTVSGSIYVWVGKQSTQTEKTEAMNKAQQYLTSKNYPSWVHVARIPQGTEPAAFKQYFTTWRDVGMAHSRLVRSPSDEEFFASDDETSTKRARLISKTGSARGFMPDEGDGTFTVYRVEGSDLVKLYDSENPGTTPGLRYGELFQGDSYVITYEYNDGEKQGNVIYYWLGKESSEAEKESAATHTVALDLTNGSGAMIVRVPQGEEPKHFLKIFKGRLVTLLGGKSSDLGSDKPNAFGTPGIRLFRVHGTTGTDMRAEQVPEETSSLRSDDAFILETPDKVYIWYGEGASDEEREEASKFVQKILGDSEYEEVQQGEETDDFWNYLGGKQTVMTKESWRRNLGKRIGQEPRLFEVSLKSDNTIQLEELSDYQQSDLQPDDVYVLDTGDEIYVWLGSEVDDRTKKAGHTIAEGYLRSNGRNPYHNVVIVIKQYLEPKIFSNLFDKWDPQMWEKRRSYDDEKDAAIALNEIE